MYAQSGNKIFFARVTDAEGIELWVTDGTASGTQLVKDIEPGTGSSTPINFAPATFGGMPGVYFVANTTANGLELWRSDGTESGTQMVKDINSGTSSAFVQSLTPQRTLVTNSAESWAVFFANNGTNGQEIWVSDDGTAGNTYLLADLNPGAGSSNPKDLKYIDGIFVFAANNATSGIEPFIFTVFPFYVGPLFDVNPGIGSSNPANMFSAGSKLVFQADDGVHGKELWQSTLSTTSLLSDFTPGNANSPFFFFHKVNSNQVIFASAEELLQRAKLHVTDGSSISTISELGCIPGGLFGFYELIYSISLPTGYNANNKVIFPCLNYTTLETEPWVSDGTPGGTGQLKDVFSGDGTSQMFTVAQADNRVIFAAEDGRTGMEPWVSDGSSAGTNILFDYNPGEASSFSPDFLSFITFQANNYSVTAGLLALIKNTEAKVLYTDGTLSNTRELFDDSTTTTENSSPARFFSIGRKIFFRALNDVRGEELYITNGNSAGTKILKNLNRGGSSSPSDVVKLDAQRQLFAASTTTAGRELWITDGTKSGTRLVRNINPGNGPHQALQIFPAALRGRVFLSANNGTTGEELWISDGTRAGTRLVKDIRPGAEGSDIDDVVKVGRRVVFVANDGVSGTELWVSSGTGASTRLLKDITVGSEGSFPNELIAVGNKVFFRATTPESGTELWVTDGTAAGTKVVKDLMPGASSSSPSLLTNSDGILFFRASEAGSGEELYRSDGSEAGTFRVADVKAGASDSDIEEIVPAGLGRVIFSADAGAGKELWVASSSAGSAQSLGASLGTNYNNLYRVPGRNQVVFAGYSASHGYELWLSDGTPAGTQMLQDLYPGSSGSYPLEFFAKGKRLFFSATSSEFGREPYMYRLP